VTETQTVDLAAWLTQIWDEEEKAAHSGKTCGEVHPMFDVYHPDGHPDDQALARIAAYRKILKDLSNYCWLWPGHPCGKCERIGCRNLRRMASPYKGREGWQEAWG